MRGMLVALALLASCRKPPAPVEPTPAPLAVEVSGCAAILEGPACELPRDRAIRVFVPGAAAETISVDGAPLSSASLRTFPEGKLLRLVIPESAARLQIDKDGKRWNLGFAKGHAYPWVLDARALRAKDPDAALAKARPALASADPEERALALGLVARIELGRGDVDSAITRFREAIALARTRISDRAEDAFALSFTLSQRRGRYDEAKAVLDRIAPALGPYPEGRARLPYYLAQVQFQQGDLRGMLQGLHASRGAASRLGLTRLERNARGLLATVLQDLGDVDAGIETLRALDAELGNDAEVTACERVQTLLNLTMALDWRREARKDLGDPVGTDDISAPAARALSQFPACTDPHLHGIALAVSAVAALTRGAIAEARALSAQSKTVIAVPRNSDKLEALWLDARIESAAGAPKRARDAHLAAIALAEASQQNDMAWRAWVGHGDALAALGDGKGALASYRRAESLVADVSLAIPLDDARGAYLTRSEVSARRILALLLADGRVDEAFLVARRARARLVSVAARALAVDALDSAARANWDAAVARFRRERAALDAAAESDWKLNEKALADERQKRSTAIAALRAALDDAMGALGPSLRAEPTFEPPKKGDLLLSFARVREGFVAFAVTHASSRYVHLSGGLELSAFAAELHAAERVIVLPYGRFRAVDVHASPFEGAPLVQRLPVVYALDVARSRGPSSSDTLGVVSDPTNDLPFARAEAKSIVELWTRSGKTPRVLEGTAASSPGVLELLGSVGTFHYAGHGVFAGVEGTESRLPLASGTHLGVLDVLAAPRVPRTVVLSACESGRSSSDALPETLGLAQAFVLAGSEVVLAPIRKVEDALAAHIAKEVHVALLSGVDPMEALRRAQIAVRKQDPTADWSAFRALRP